MQAIILKVDEKGNALYNQGFTRIIDNANPRKISAKLKTLPPGIYRIEYHKTSGGISDLPEWEETITTTTQQ